MMSLGDRVIIRLSGSTYDQVDLDKWNGRRGRLISYGPVKFRHVDVHLDEPRPDGGLFSFEGTRIPLVAVGVDDVIPEVVTIPEDPW